MPLKSSTRCWSPCWHITQLNLLHITLSFRSIQPSISPLSLLFSVLLLLHLAHDEVSPLCPWVDENPLWQKVFVCAYGSQHVCNVFACSCLSLQMCMCVCVYVCVHACVCSTCVWPTLACRSERHQDCAVTAGEEMIYLSGGWGTGRQIQLTDKCTAAGGIM